MVLPIVHTSTKKLNFMVIDDDVSICECLTLIISITGNHSNYFLNPIDAFDAFQTNSLGFDGIFTDLRMPEMHGDEFIARVRDIQSQVPIVIVTGTNITISDNDLQLLGIEKIISKPFDVSEIEEMIHLFEDRYIIHQQYTPFLKNYIK